MPRSRTSPFRPLAAARPSVPETPAVPVVLTEVAFFKLHARILQLQAFDQAVVTQRAPLAAAAQAAMTGAGLNPAVDYSLDETTFTATPRVDRPAVT